MSVIIRLQNLPWSANALDIRQYFRGLSIPEGGVHIVGGEQGDAFIAFSTDEDARQGMMLDGGKIKEVKIKLFLSSRAEMQKVIEHARQQSMTLQSFMQMPAPAITSTTVPVHSLQTSLMNQIPSTTVPTVPVSSSAPVTTVVPDVIQSGITMPERRDSREMDRDKKDTDSISSVSKDSKRDRRERSRSRDADRRDRKDRDRDRHRDRDRDRDRDRRRRDRSRSRERSSRRRDRRDRSRTRDRSRSRDHTSRDRERDTKRNSRERKRDSLPPVAEDDKNKDQNGDIIILNTFPPAGKDRVVPQPAAVASPSKSNMMQQQQQQQQQPVVTSSSWDAPTGPSMPSFKSAGMGSRPLSMPMDTSSDRQLEGRRLLGNTSFAGESLRPLGMSLGGSDALQSFSRRDPFSTTRDSGMSSMSLRGRESWPPGRQANDLGRFGRERVSNFQMSQGGFNNEHDDFDREMDPRGGYRGAYRGMDYRRGGFPSRDTRLGGPGGSLLDRMGPAVMSQNELDDRRMGSTYPSSDRRTPFRMERGDMDSFQRMDRFDQFDRSQMNERQFPPTRAGMPDRFQREKYGTPEQNFEPRSQFPGNCIEIRNTPIEAGYNDIRRFFQRLHIANNGIKLINDNHGNRVGIAYVKFQKREGKEEALTYNGRPLRGSAVEVLHLTEDIFEKAIDSYKPPEVEPEPEPELEEIKEDPFVCLCIKELPPYAKESDIFKLFTDIPVSEIFIAQNTDETKQDIAYVKFDSHESAQRALHSNTKHMIGQKQVTLAPCPLEELEEARKRKKVEVPKVEEPKQQPPPAQQQQQPQQPAPQSQPQPQPSPVVENKPEPIQNSKPQDPRNRNEAPPVQEQPQQKLMMPQSDCILLRGLPVHANDRDILDFFSDVGLVPLRIHIMLDKFGKPIGDAFCEFNTLEEAARAFTKNGTPLGKQEVSVKPVLRAEMNEALGVIPQTEMPMSQVGMTRMQPHGRDFGGRPAGLLGMTPSGPPMGRMPLLGRHPGSLPPGAMQAGGQPLDAFGNPGCVVSLENIPFRADIDEILDFLGDFDVSRENVMRRFTDKGLPTGDARVAFMSPSEAQRAVRELRFRKIRGRPIYLKLLK